MDASWLALCDLLINSVSFFSFFSHRKIEFLLIWRYNVIANLVLQDTIERIYVGNCYGDIPRGIFLIRGENVVLLGEIVSIKKKKKKWRKSYNKHLNIVFDLGSGKGRTNKFKAGTCRRNFGCTTWRDWSKGEGWKD